MEQRAVLPFTTSYLRHALPTPHLTFTMRFPHHALTIPCPTFTISYIHHALPSLRLTIITSYLHQVHHGSGLACPGAPLDERVVLRSKHLGIGHA